MNIDEIRAAAESESCVEIHIGSSAADTNAARIFRIIHDAVDHIRLRAKIFRTGSFGCYDLEPIVLIGNPDLSAVLYKNVTPDSAQNLISDFFVKGIQKNERAFCSIGQNRAKDIPHISELPLFNLQKRIALRNCGWIDPENIHQYIARGRGYTTLSKALKADPRILMETLIRPVLKGRCESYVSATDKWKICRETAAGNQYLVCNAVDTDPQALTSRLLLEGDPHSVLEGMLIGAYVIGASRCLICLRTDSSAAEFLRKALEQMRVCNLLGAGILDSHFNAEIEIKEVPASLTTGHLTELLRCVEEGQSLPHIIPAGPSVDEFAGKPAIVANPEIFSSLSDALIEDTKESKATKVVTLAGRVSHKYTVEVPLGTTIREIVEKLGGGASGGKTVKAVQVGGPAGVFVGPDSLDIPVDCDTAEESRSNIDTGTIEVLDIDSHVVDMTRNIMSYLQTQSCGKCLFCREGCLQMLTILEDISDNRGKPQDLDLLAELGEEMRTACLCAFGRTAPNPVLSSIRLFREEYDERLKGFP